MNWSMNVQLQSMAPWFETLFSAGVELERILGSAFSLVEHGCESKSIELDPSSFNDLITKIFPACSSIYPQIILIAKFFSLSEDIAGYAVYLDGEQVGFAMDDFDDQSFIDLYHFAQQYDANRWDGSDDADVPPEVLWPGEDHFIGVDNEGDLITA